MICWFSNEATLTGNNPKPVCISMPQVPSIKLCAVFSNVYFAGRNLHMCIDMEGRWIGTSVFKISFNCIRMGFNGVALLKPEDGGGLPHGTIITGEDEDYDDYLWDAATCTAMKHYNGQQSLFLLLPEWYLVLFIGTWSLIPNLALKVL